jgi:uncharacterized membrane protein YGL010W
MTVESQLKEELINSISDLVYQYYKEDHRNLLKHVRGIFPFDVVYGKEIAHKVAIAAVNGTGDISMDTIRNLYKPEPPQRQP